MTDVTPPVAMSTDFTTYLAHHAEQMRRLDECRPANMAALFDALATAGITHVIVTFDGGGDSGQIESVDASNADGAVALPEADFAYASPGEGEAFEHSAMSLKDAIEELAYDLLRDTHAGWENNDGAFGEFTFDVAARTISLDHNERYTAIESYSHEW
jgi:hypothetical protein